MCLAVPGKVIERRGNEATVDFQGSRVDVSVMLTPDVRVGGWVLVHAGYAINELDEAEAIETWSYLNALDVAGELGIGAAEGESPSDPPGGSEGSADK
jgi:hydrogenase expression/formation protein HypC